MNRQKRRAGLVALLVVAGSLALTGVGIGVPTPADRTSGPTAAQQSGAALAQDGNETNTTTTTTGQPQPAAVANETTTTTTGQPQPAAVANETTTAPQPTTTTEAAGTTTETTFGNATAGEVVTVPELLVQNLTLDNVVVRSGSIANFSLSSGGGFDDAGVSAQRAEVGDATMRNVTLYNVTVRNDTLANEMLGVNLTNTSFDSRLVIPELYLSNETVSGLVLGDVVVRSSAVDGVQVQQGNGTGDVGAGRPALSADRAVVGNVSASNVSFVGYDSGAAPDDEVTGGTTTAGAPTGETETGETTVANATA